MKLNKAQIRGAVEAFKKVSVKHDLLLTTLDHVLFMLELSPNVDIVNLVGPTGIGKTLLQMRLIDQVRDECRDEMAADPDFVPIIRTHALAAGHRLFDWKLLYRSALAALGDPFAMERSARTAQDSRSIHQFKHAGESRTAAELRLRLEQEFRIRRTLYWIIDEGQHMAFGGRSGLPGDQFDVIKSIAQSAQIKLLIAGPHEMEPALGSSGQLARRSSTVHFRRYQATNVAHMATFRSVAGTLFDKMDLAGHPAVQEALTMLYTGSAGCVGILKDWLAKAYGAALREHQGEGKATLTLDHLRQTRLSAKAMTTIMLDIRREEEGMVELASDAEYERIVLGVPATPARGADQGGSRRITQSRRVGERKPSRDPVGVPFKDTGA